MRVRLVQVLRDQQRRHRSQHGGTITWLGHDDVMSTPICLPTPPWVSTSVAGLETHSNDTHIASSLDSRGRRGRNQPRTHTNLGFWAEFGSSPACAASDDACSRACKRLGDCCPIPNQPERSGLYLRGYTVEQSGLSWWCL